jgi:hypothetical protein
MRFQQLREEAEILLAKYQDSKDEDEMRLISNRFSEVDAIMEQRPADEDSKNDESSSESVTTENSAPATLLESIPFEAVTANVEAIPTPKVSVTPDQSQEETKSETSALSAPGLPKAIETKKPTSALDLMPIPDLEGPAAIVEEPLKKTQTKSPSASYSGDLGAALASVKELVDEYSSPSQVEPNPTTNEPEASTGTGTGLVDEIETEHEAEEENISHQELNDGLNTVEETPDQEPSKIVMVELVEDVIPIPEADLEIDGVPEEECPTDQKAPKTETPVSESPKPNEQSKDTIPKSACETLPKFQLSAKMRICHQCGHETRLSREECQKCNYVDQSLGILDAVIAGNLEKVRQILLVKPLVVMTRTSHHGWTMLHMAASGGNANMVQLLIDKGATVNGQNTFGKTSLHYAASKGHREIVNTLLRHHADTEMEFEGKTALELAKENGHQEIIEILSRY